MTTKIWIAAAVISLAALGAALSAPSETQLDEHAKRQAAITWAIQQQQVAASKVLAPASRTDVVLPVCRVVTIRPASLSDDWREFHILIKERCDHTIAYAAVTLMPKPLIFQLAEMRIQDSSISVESAVSRLKFERTELRPKRAIRILALLDRTRLPLKPMQAFELDRPGVEVGIASWGEVRVTTFLSDTRPGWKQLNAAIKEALNLSEIHLDRLSFDPNEIER